MECKQGAAYAKAKSLGLFVDDINEKGEVGLLHFSSFETQAWQAHLKRVL
jgi:hypothetical protein